MNRSESRRFGAEASRFGDASPERDFALRFGALSGSGFSLGFCFSAEASSDFGLAFFFAEGASSDFGFAFFFTAGASSGFGFAFFSEGASSGFGLALFFAEGASSGFGLAFFFAEDASSDFGLAFFRAAASSGLRFAAVSFLASDIYIIRSKYRVNLILPDSRRADDPIVAEIYGFRKCDLLLF